MKAQLSISSTLIVLTLLFMASTCEEEADRQYGYYHKFDKSSITLKGNGKFYQYKRSCTYAFKSTGTWSLSGDTILLNREKLKWKFGSIDESRSSKLLIISKDSLQYVWDAEFGIGDAFILVMTE